MTLDQTEMFHIIMSPKAKPAVSTRPNKHFCGSTAGNALFGVGGPESASDWVMTVADKKKLYGPEARTVDFDPETHKSKLAVREDDSHEPVNFWSMSSKLYEELIHRLNVSAVIDLTAADPLANVCIGQGLRYCGICFNDIHVDLLHQRLSGLVFQSMSTEGSAHYDPSLAQIVDRLTASTPHPAKQRGKKPKAKAKTTKSTATVEV